MATGTSGESGLLGSDEGVIRGKTMNFWTSCETDEWYTPTKYLDLVRQVIGEIELDPCSCPEAQLRVRAKNWSTRYDLSLYCSWKTPKHPGFLGRFRPVDRLFGTRKTASVFCNPPFSLVSQFSKQMMAEYEHEAFEQGILLVNATTEASWFKPLWNYDICLTDHRINFDAPEGWEWKLTPDKSAILLDKNLNPIRKSRNTKGQAFIYMGSNSKLFAEVFSSIGEVIPARESRAIA
jgi:hypothetical protein